MSDIEVKYGFRYDPKEWVNGDDSALAALVRRDVFGEPKSGDVELQKKRICMIEKTESGKETTEAPTARTGT